jgi:hypothetical protein
MLINNTAARTISPAAKMSDACISEISLFSCFELVQRHASSFHFPVTGRAETRPADSAPERPNRRSALGSNPSGLRLILDFLNAKLSRAARSRAFDLIADLATEQCHPNGRNDGIIFLETSAWRGNTI